ncbi:MAG TPA: hypothetical protein VGF20_10380 [Candidatus Acidoferrum sp.]
MNDAEERENRMEDEKLSTADLAGASREDTTDSMEARKHRIAGDVHTDSSEERREMPRATAPINRSTELSPSVATATGAAAVMAKDPESGPLFSPEEAGDLRSKWDAIQGAFVDEPRKAVQQADSLVAMAMKSLAEQFASQRSTIEGQWDRGGDVSTEDLRLVLRRYRSFFGRLLSV